MVDFIEPEMVRIIHQKPDKVMVIEMVHLPKGRFIMGEGSEQREVILDYEFEIGKYPVTIGEYMTFVEDTQTHYPKWLGKDNEFHIETGTNNYYKKMNLTDKSPIIGVSWYDAVAYCKWLNKKANRNYRLPTEIEWEYACRAGTTTKWSFGESEKELDKYAWYYNNSNGTTHLVGEKKPNPWGLYDMHGNVWEWCENWYDKDKKRKVVRGGSCRYNAFRSISTYRSGRIPYNCSNNRGFRIGCNLKNTKK